MDALTDPDPDKTNSDVVEEFEAAGSVVIEPVCVCCVIDAPPLTVERAYPMAAARFDACALPDEIVTATPPAPGNVIDAITLSVKTGRPRDPEPPTTKNQN